MLKRRAAFSAMNESCAIGNRVLAVRNLAPRPSRNATTGFTEGLRKSVWLDSYLAHQTRLSGHRSGRNQL
jgi:hypothetical protein